jgi:hypothetical protein
MIETLENIVKWKSLDALHYCISEQNLIFPIAFTNHKIWIQSVMDSHNKKDTWKTQGFMIDTTDMHEIYQRRNRARPDAWDRIFLLWVTRCERVQFGKLANLIKCYVERKRTNAVEPACSNYFFLCNHIILWICHASTAEHTEFFISCVVCRLEDLNKQHTVNWLLLYGIVIIS